MMFLKSKVLRILIALAIGLIPLFNLLPVYAMAHPDSTPTITNTHVNRNLVVSGDMLVYGLYNIPYASPQTIAADQSFIIRLMDVAGTTELGRVTPFPYFLNGYNLGIFSMYFSVAPSLSSLPYIVRVSENPSQVGSTSTDYAIPTTAYTLFTTQSDNQYELASNLYTLGHQLETRYSSTLFVQSGNRIVLTSPTGEYYFRGAIYGSQAMAPSLYLVQEGTVDLTSTNWTTTAFDSYEARWAGTWVETSENATANQFGITPQMSMGLIIILPLCVGTVALSSMKLKRVEPGFIVCALFLIMGVLLGWLPVALFAILFQTMGIYIAYVLFMARA